MASYLRTSMTVYNSKSKSGEWISMSIPVYWNAFNAVVTVKDKNGKEYKIILVNFFLNQ